MYNTLSLFYVIFIPILAIVLLLLNFFLAKKAKTPDVQKFSTYESGFDAIQGITRVPFDVRYFKVIIAFLFFDIDVNLFFPFVSLAGTSIITSIEVTVAIISTIIFFIGLIYDLTNGLADYAQSNKSSKLSPRSVYFTGNQRRGYSTKASSDSNLNSLSNLSSLVVSGFCDAESSFMIRFTQSSKYILG
jgi:NADH-quinone oxidoreductase subunit A